jgi:hypothetical protein
MTVLNEFYTWCLPVIMLVMISLLMDRVRRLELRVKYLDEKRQQADAKQREEDLQKRLASRRMHGGDTR